MACSYNANAQRHVPQLLERRRAFHRRLARAVRQSDARRSARLVARLLERRAAESASDTRRRFSTYNGGSYSRNEIDGWGAGWFASIDFRPTTATTISMQPIYSASNSKLQYVQSQTDAAATKTFGRQYVFSEVKQHSLDLTTRLNVTFRPNLSLQLYTQPFMATADYHGLKELARASSHRLRGVSAGRAVRRSSASTRKQHADRAAIGDRHRVLRGRSRRRRAAPQRARSATATSIPVR